MKTALVLCPQWDTSFPVYSLALLRGALQARGHETSVFDLNAELSARGAAPGEAPFAPAVNAANPWSDSVFVAEKVIPAYADFFDAAVDRILSGGARVVGFSVFYSNAVLSLFLAERLKRRDPGVQIIFGGPNCLAMKGCLGFLENAAVDAVIFGEGDLSLPAYVDSLQKNGRARAGSGILLREDRSTWIESQEPIENLDDLPFADYGGHRLELYGNRKTIHSCRGCVRHCVFCSDWREMTYRQMGGERIYAEIKKQLARDPAARTFLFGDSILNSSKKSMATFCDLMKTSALGVDWGGFAIVRADMSAEFMADMRAGGCGWLTFGIESGSEAVLRHIGKNVDPALNARVLADAATAGIDTEATWLVGFPTETAASFEESMAFLRANARGIKRLYPSLFSVQTMLESGESLGFDTDHVLYWTGEGGRNTYPVRVERLRRLVKESNSFGIETRFEDKFGADTIDTCCDALLERFRREASN